MVLNWYQNNNQQLMDNYDIFRFIHYLLKKCVSFLWRCFNTGIVTYVGAYLIPKTTRSEISSTKWTISSITLENPFFGTYKGLPDNKTIGIV